MMAPLSWISIYNFAVEVVASLVLRIKAFSYSLITEQIEEGCCAEICTILTMGMNKN